MARFLNKLQQLVQVATARGVLSPESAEALIALAKETEDKTERTRGMLGLASVLGWLGGGIVVLGIILLLAANWSDIGDSVKIGGFLLVLAGTHGVALWIRWTDRPYPRTAEAFHFVGAGLFLAGVGLITQIYQLDIRPPNFVFLWFVAIAPLAVMLRSATISALAILAGIIWLHLEGSNAGSPAQIFGYTSHLSLEIGIGTALLGFSSLVRAREPEVSHVMRALGALLLFYGVYMLGFYRYFTSPAVVIASAGELGTISVPARPWLLPLTALLLGGFGLGAGWTRLAPESERLRNAVVALLAVLLTTCAVAVAGAIGTIPRGPAFDVFNFGAPPQTFDVAGSLVSVTAWALWFLLALWCVAFGSQSGRRRYLDAGVAGVGLGVITRFFDLIGGLAETGTLFLIGGLVLLGTGWVLEKWRRSMLARLGEAA